MRYVNSITNVLSTPHATTTTCCSCRVTTTTRDKILLLRSCFKHGFLASILNRDRQQHHERAADGELCGQLSHLLPAGQEVSAHIHGHVLRVATVLSPTPTRQQHRPQRHQARHQPKNIQPAVTGGLERGRPAGVIAALVPDVQEQAAVGVACDWEHQQG